MLGILDLYRGAGIRFQPAIAAFGGERRCGPSAEDQLDVLDHRALRQFEHDSAGENGHVGGVRPQHHLVGRLERDLAAVHAAGRLTLWTVLLASIPSARQCRQVQRFQNSAPTDVPRPGPPGSHLPRSGRSQLRAGSSGCARWPTVAVSRSVLVPRRRRPALGNVSAADPTALREPLRFLSTAQQGVATAGAEDAPHHPKRERAVGQPGKQSSLTESPARQTKHVDPDNGALQRTPTDSGVSVAVAAVVRYRSADRRTPPPFGRTRP